MLQKIEVLPGSFRLRRSDLEAIAGAVRALSRAAGRYNNQPDSHPMGVAALELLLALLDLERMLNPERLDFDRPERMSGLQGSNQPPGTVSDLLAVRKH